MQHRIRTPTGHHNHPNRILKRRLRHNIPRLNILLQQQLHRLTRSHALIPFLLRIRRTTRRIRQTHPQSLDGRRHRIRRVHPPARSRSGTRMLHDLLPLLLRNLIVQKRSVTLERTDDIEGLPRRRLMSRADGPAVDHNAGTIETSHPDDHSRHVLVAPGQRDEAIVPLGAHGRFDAVGDQIAGLEGVSHAGGAHADSVGDADGVEAESDAVAGYDAGLDVFGEFEEVHVAGVAFVPDAADTYLGFGHVFFGKAGGVEHGLGCSLGGWLG
mmetsp:Transcript_654/g.1137  ORF Transcript_654/g.1137 Transcript_654/m.1137 type:complete len:270 (+) Transcript_654:417-1226(+)